MKTKDNHSCLVCGSKYTYCPNCSEYDKFPRWMGIFCSENCHDIFDIANDYAHELMTKEDAKEALKDKDLSMKGKYTGGVKKAINEILREDKSVKENEKSHEKNYSQKNYSHENKHYEKKENGFKKQQNNVNAVEEKTVDSKIETISKVNDTVMKMSFNKNNN